jgi:hypothetical protein
VESEGSGGHAAHGNLPWAVRRSSPRAESEQEPQRDKQPDCKSPSADSELLQLLPELCHTPFAKFDRLVADRTRER